MNLSEYWNGSIKGSGNPTLNPAKMEQITKEFQDFHDWCIKTGNHPGLGTTITKYFKEVKSC
jgi:hypothetical protein